MKTIAEFVEAEGMRCWTDIGPTKFPVKERGNYRLDITDGDTSKGASTQFLVEYTGCERFTCIGNGQNDVSMFKVALDSGMQVVIVKNYERGILAKESERLIKEVTEYAESIGRAENVLVQKYPINGYMVNLEERKSAKEKRKQFANGIKHRTNGVKEGINEIRHRNMRRVQDRRGEK